MKEGFFKKLAIGVAVSLVSTTVIAGVSGLFSGVGSGGSGSVGGNVGNNDVCQHETRTTDGEIAPTCILGGVSGMVRCLDCGEIVVEGEELPPTGHTGELGETCTVCKEVIYGQYQNANIYTLQDIDVGEKVAGNWYRVYYDEQVSMAMAVKNEVGQSISFVFHGSYNNVGLYGDNMYALTSLEDGFPFVYGLDNVGAYFDVYFKEGAIVDDSYPSMDENGEGYLVEVKIVVDKDTTVSILNTTVKRLLFGE